jgi:hypothetical protein
LSKPLKYTDKNDPAWSAAAVKSFQVMPLPDSDDPVALELNGLCPNCEDHMQHTEFLIAFKGVSPTSPDTLHAIVKTLRNEGQLNKPLLPTEVSIQCCCQVKHPDPLGRSGLIGCGATWKMRFESFDEGTK